MPGVTAALVSVCAGIVAVVPLAIKPVTPSGLEPVQVKVVPATLLVIAILCVDVPLQIVCAGGRITAGVGLTIAL